MDTNNGNKSIIRTKMLRTSVGRFRSSTYPRELVLVIMISVQTCYVRIFLVRVKSSVLHMYAYNNMVNGNICYWIEMWQEQSRTVANSYWISPSLQLEAIVLSLSSKYHSSSPSSSRVHVWKGLYCQDLIQIQTNVIYPHSGNSFIIALESIFFAFSATHFSQIEPTSFLDLGTDFD